MSDGSSSKPIGTGRDGKQAPQRDPTSDPSSITRSPPVRYEPLTHGSVSEDDGPAEEHRKGTVRRKEREQRGSLLSSSHTRPDAVPSGTHTDDGGLPEASQPPQPRSAASSIRHQVVSPEHSIKPKKPTLSRRGTSHAATPHKGQQFSVDDDKDEIQERLAQRQTPSVTSVSGRGTLRRRASTLRRRGTAQAPTLPRVDSSNEEEAVIHQEPLSTEDQGLRYHGDSADDGVLPHEGAVVEGEDEDEDEDAYGSDASDESFTLKDRQDAINETHPFGIRIWKPALYKKSRSVQKTAEGDIHSSPNSLVNPWLFLFNVLWTVAFGWWLSLAALAGAVVCFLFGFAPSSVAYGRILLGLARYLLYPFGQFVKLEQDEAYADEDEGEGRSISEYEQWQSGDLEDGRLFFGPVTPQPARGLVGRRRSSLESAGEEDSLLGRTGRRSYDDNDDDDDSGEPNARGKRRLFGRGPWNLGRVIFFVFLYGLIAPLLLLVSAICWLMVFWIPMGKVTLLLFYHLRRHPLALSFHYDSAYSRDPGAASSSILLCTYRAVGSKYWKYTVDGTNIILINLLGVVVFVIVDYWVLKVMLNLHSPLTHPGFIFMLALFSIIPLAYFIGQAVASISAQSSMGLGAAINAFFSTVVEVFLYCVALKQGKGKLVEGSIIGSIFAGILFLPGLSMCFGAIKRKTQRFNAKSAGVTSTMLLFAMIAAFGPTLFYQIYGTHELNCLSCVDTVGNTASRDCRRCYFSQQPAINDRFFNEAVRPYCWFAAFLLFLSYIIGLWFTLRTHAAVIWATEADEKRAQSTGPNSLGASVPDIRGSNGSVLHGTSPARPPNSAAASTINPRASIRTSQLYKRILGQSLRQAGIGSKASDPPQVDGPTSAPSPPPHMVPPKSSNGESPRVRGAGLQHVPGLSEEEDQNLARGVGEMAATAATVAARDALRSPRKTSLSAQTPASVQRSVTSRYGTFAEYNEETAAAEALAHSGGHDAPNWSRAKSSIILLGATILYAIIAEILVSTVDVVLEKVDIDEKFLGITLFALVPNTTEFLNAISFAMNGNIALSMEIGSAYALQVCLLQIPALVLYSAVQGQWVSPEDLLDHTFTLIFPQFDVVTIVLCVFLLSYMYSEGKSNYFKGSILILSYLVVVLGFYFSGFTDLGEDDVMSRFTPMAGTTPHHETFKTIGRSKSGRAY
ncbi:MAG: hypothetical protein M1832_000601 [Thelocarpon impressellum]|nr:MAG: hypothetical protein M1832_000601 [Thelocarpon impressellum]